MRSRGEAQETSAWSKYAQTFVHRNTIRSGFRVMKARVVQAVVYL